MALPSRNVELFRRIARERLDDAVFLHANGRNSTAVYLGGYVIECALKALILAAVPRDREEDVMRTFRGSAAHNYEHLQDQYSKEGGAALPQDVKRDLTNVAGWQVAFRYNTRKVESTDARSFLDSARKILFWAEGRL